MLIKDYELEIFTPPCEPGAERFTAVAHLPVSISEVLPLLNATLRGAVHHPGAQALTWKKEGHNIAFHADRIATGNVEDRDAAIRKLEGLVDLVNRTWERRDQIEPDHETHQRPTPMAVYQLLPQTNCRRCGEPTCFTFALKLTVAQRPLEDCPVLLEPDRAEQRAELEAIIVDAPGIGG
ncbi:MAG: (Fe-S)-binding protein [Anaerolineales bacterium]|nr:(Fe-S)-binding protein [Anaerolineales bacterium]